ncbi:MAG TPA: hypothetical protein H9955_13485 [Candidatus Mediterraneibacter cottocaccae]|nr:hypothetical protein [Candidatus Mediterraneibacter cottocaccae]
MKNAKKLLAVGLTVCTAAAMTACGGGAEDQTYTVTYDNSLGSDVLDAIPDYQFVASDLSWMISYGMNLDVTLDLTADGNYTLTSHFYTQGEPAESDPTYSNIQMVATGTYTQEDDKVTISVPDSATATYEGGAYITEQGMYEPFSYAEDGSTGEWTSDDVPEILDCVPETVFTVTDDGAISTWEPAGEAKGNPKGDAAAAGGEEGTDAAAGTDATADAAAGTDAAGQTAEAAFTMTSPEWDAVTMTFNTDGTCAFNMAEYGITEECTWTFADGVLTVTKSDGTTAVSEMDGDTMKLSYDSVTAPGQMIGNFESTDWADFFQ